MLNERYTDRTLGVKQARKIIGCNKKNDNVVIVCVFVLSIHIRSTTCN